MEGQGRQGDAHVQGWAQHLRLGAAGYDWVWHVWQNAIDGCVWVGLVGLRCDEAFVFRHKL